MRLVWFAKVKINNSADAVSRIVDFFIKSHSIFFSLVTKYTYTQTFSGVLNFYHFLHLINIIVFAQKVLITFVNIQAVVNRKILSCHYAGSGIWYILLRRELQCHTNSIH